MSQALSSLNTFASISETMLQVATDQEWEKLAQLGRERADLVNALPENLARHLLPSEYSSAKEILENCRRLDAQTFAIIGERQDELRILLREPALA